QAEDGIRDRTVTGVQTCALPICQEDLQWYTDNSDQTLRTDPTRGDPAYSQNWGHVKQDTGLTGGANSVPAAEWGCNAHLYGLKRSEERRVGKECRSRRAAEHEKK